MHCTCQVCHQPIGNNVFSKWVQGGKDCHINDLTEFQPKQKMYFLEVLIKHAPLSHEIIQRLEDTYHFSTYQNVEIVYRYLILSLKSKFTGVLPQVSKFLSSHGRGLYVSHSSETTLID